jgi:hypothetical protein
VICIEVSLQYSFHPHRYISCYLYWGFITMPSSPSPSHFLWSVFRFHYNTFFTLTDTLPVICIQVSLQYLLHPHRHISCDLYSGIITISSSPSPSHILWSVFRFHYNFVFTLTVTLPVICIQVSLQYLLHPHRHTSCDLYGSFITISSSPSPTHFLWSV